jgi:hypothetical protein
MEGQQGTKPRVSRSLLSNGCAESGVERERGTGGKLDKHSGLRLNGTRIVTRGSVSLESNREIAHWLR